MATQDLVPGNRFRLYRESDTTPGHYDFMCLGITITFNRSNTYDDATVVDCTDPLARPMRRSVKKTGSWSLNFSGKVDAVLFEKLEADFEADGAHNYQLLIDLSSAKGGRTYTGALHFETLEMGKTDNGIVSFTSQCRGDGPYVMAAVA